jgi:acyl-CoA thioesterase FadM
MCRVILLLRLLLTIAISSLKRRIGPFGTSSVRFRVWPNDLDLNMHMNSGRYVSFMDVGRIDLLVRMRLFRDVMRRGWRPIAGATMIRYRRSLTPFERFTLQSRVVTWDEKWFYFEHIMENSKGEVAAIAYVRGLLRGRDGNVAPRDFIALSAQPDLQSPPIPEAIARWNEAEAVRG